MRIAKVIALSYVLCSACTAQASGFLFGLLAGMVISGNGAYDANNALKQSGLNAIPLRCLTVDSEADYVDCRWTSMMAEIQAPRNNAFTDPIPYCAGILAPDKWSHTPLAKLVEPHRRACDVEWHIKLEIKALKSLSEAMNAQKKP